MTAKAAICKALLFGKVVNIGNGFKYFGVTNIPREIGRQVERAFGILVDREKKSGITRWEQYCTWTDYRLKITKENAGAVQAMAEYVIKKSGEAITGEQQSDIDKLNRIILYTKKLSSNESV